MRARDDGVGCWAIMWQLESERCLLVSSLGVSRVVWRVGGVRVAGVIDGRRILGQRVVRFLIVPARKAHIHTTDVIRTFRFVYCLSIDRLYS